MTVAVATAQLDQILLEASTTTQQKIDCLKVLKVVVKNLSDPTKAQDAKYRQLKLDNEKVRVKLLACSAAVPLLQAIGFVQTTENGFAVLRIANDTAIDQPTMTALLHDIGSTLQTMEQASNVQHKKPKFEHSNSSCSTTSSASSMTATEKLSEKQKARRLLEEKQQKEREAAKAHRQQNVAMLKQDKYVRQNDENWKSGVSAACAKSGDSISTFRDKFGEH